MHWYMEVMRKYAVFRGRARRKEYWMFQLTNMLVIIILAFSLALVIPSAIHQNRSPLLLFVVLIVAYILAAAVPSVAVSVRRLHDTNLSGWWVLLGMVPLGGIVLLVMHVLDSVPGPNLYGPNPKGVSSPAYAGQVVASTSQAMASAAGAGVASQSSRWFLGFCNGCGTQVNEGARFCPKCGKAAY